MNTNPGKIIFKDFEKLHVSKFAQLQIVFETVEDKPSWNEKCFPLKKKGKKKAKKNRKLQSSRESYIRAVNGSSIAGWKWSACESLWEGKKMLQLGYEPRSWVAFEKNSHKAITTSPAEVKISWIRHQGCLIHGEWKLQFLLLEEKIKWALTDVFRMLNRRSSLTYHEVWALGICKWEL